MTTATKLPIIQETMIHAFQCPGCVNGNSPTNCKHIRPDVDSDGGFRCENHVLGTFVNLKHHRALGLPRGFDRPGGWHTDVLSGQTRDSSKMFIRLWEAGKAPDWNKFNVPVWAMEKDGHLFVRTYMPRIGWVAVDVIKDGKLAELCPNTIDVGEFYDEID